MWSSLTVLPPLDMSIVVVGVESEGEGRPRGNLGSCGVFSVSAFSDVGFGVLFSCELEDLATCEFDASDPGWIGDDMLRVCENLEGWNARRRRGCARWNFENWRIDFIGDAKLIC
jgi:hypothetical protein